MNAAEDTTVIEFEDITIIDFDTSYDFATKQAGRRFADCVSPWRRPLQLDRRAGGRDRRLGITQEYCGAPRRITIDRRTGSRGRRKVN